MPLIILQWKQWRKNGIASPRKIPDLRLGKEDAGVRNDIKFSCHWFTPAVFVGRGTERRSNLLFQQFNKPTLQSLPSIPKRTPRLIAGYDLLK
jgi:hypothetical protein